MQQDDQDADGLLSRAELEIELARLVLSVTRRVPQPPDPANPPDAAFVGWFKDSATQLVNSVAPDLRPFAMERLEQIASSTAGLEITELQLTADSWSFAPAPDPSDEPPAPTDDAEKPRAS